MACCSILARAGKNSRACGPYILPLYEGDVTSRPAEIFSSILLCVANVISCANFYVDQPTNYGHTMVEVGVFS
jgi:hypothetical protein